MKISDRDFERLRDYMYNKYGINLAQKRVLIEGRLSLVVSQKGYNDFTQYIDALFSDTTGSEVSLLVSKLTTNYTYFLREEGHYDFMVQKVLPQWKTKPAGSELRIWSAASSSGEEPYSIAMVTSNYFAMNRNVRINIHASDISENVLGQARSGIYNTERIAKLPKDWVTKFFKKTGDDEYVIIDQLKSLVAFKYFNLNDSIGWQRNYYDIIFCRNVMIYFDQPTRQALSKKLFEALKPGGYLFIGMSETLVNLKTDFDYVQPSIYMRKN